MNTIGVRLAPGREGAAMALGSMVCVQVGLAISVRLFDEVGPEGTAWLRLSWAGVLLLLVARRRISRIPRSSLAASVVLGVVTAGMTMLFMAAVERLPLGTASALEFLGPLGVAVTRSRKLRQLLWPALAAVGLLLLTQPWQGVTDLTGVAFALGAAACWASYILLTQAVGDRVAGVAGLAVSFPVAAVAATLVAGPSVISSITPQVALVGLGLALLLPVVPFSLEMLALRRLTAAAFGTLMSLEPAIALVLGLVLLHQVPSAWSLVGIMFVVTAGVGAERTGARVPKTSSLTGSPDHAPHREEGPRGCDEHADEQSTAAVDESLHGLQEASGRLGSATQRRSGARSSDQAVQHAWTIGAGSAEWDGYRADGERGTGNPPPATACARRAPTT